MTTLAPVHCKQLKTWTMIQASAVAVSVTGTLVETTLATIALPAVTLGPNGRFRLWHLWSFNNNANNKIFRVKFGASMIYQVGRSTQQSEQAFTIIRNRNNQAIQIGPPLVYDGIGTGGAAAIAYAIDTSLAQNITLTALLANVGDTVTLESYSLEVLYGA